MALTASAWQATIRTTIRATMRASGARATGLALCAGLMSLGMASSDASAQTAFSALNSYAQPPFVATSASEVGLAGLFTKLLNDELGSAAKFNLEVVPRKRLDLLLADAGFTGVALFLAPEFMSTQRRDFSWSVPIMIDENLIVSARRLQLTSLSDLDGLRMGAISGHVYRVLGPRIAEQRIEREDAPDHVSNLKKLCLGRVDFAVMSRSEFNGSIELARCQLVLQPTSFPEPQLIVRRVLVRLPDAQGPQVLDAVRAVGCSDAWRTALRRYGLSTVGCRDG